MDIEMIKFIVEQGGFAIAIVILWKVMRRQDEQNDQLQDLMNNHLDSAQKERKNMREDYGTHIRNLQKTMQNGFNTLHKDLKALRDHFKSEDN